MIDRLVELAQKRVDKYGAQYYTFAIFGAINYPLAYLYEYYVENSTAGVWLRLTASFLCWLLLLKHKFPKSVQKFLPLYWYFAITISIPILATYMLLRDSFSLGWLMNFNIGAMIMVLLLDSVTFLILETIGLVIGILLFYFSGHTIAYLPSNEHITLFVYMFVCIVVIGAVFSRNKELFHNFLHKTKDDFNKQLEVMVQQRTAELEKALAAKTEFLNNMSHEVRTPIQGFTNISEGLVSHWKEFNDERKLELANQVASNARRLSMLVGGLLDLSKFSAGKMLLELRQVDLNEIIEAVIEESRTLYLNGKVIEIEFSPIPDVLAVADPERMAQVLRNLFVNAIKFSPSNSRIVAKLVQSEIVYDDQTKAEAVHFSIADHGLGVPKGEFESIFTPFTQSSRTKTKAGGTGLGLAICRDIIEAHHGKIWAENNIPGGSVFNFIIPTKQTTTMEGHKIIEQSDVTVPKGTTKTRPPVILLVDDEESCLIGMELLLYGTGYQLVKASGGLEALKYLQENPGSIDLVLLDLMMPDMYGLKLLDAMKQDPNLAKIPVILQTGTSDIAEVEKAYKMGIVCYIKKPYQKKLVLTEIAKVL